MKGLTRQLRDLYRIKNAINDEPYEPYSAVKGYDHVAEIAKHFLDEHCGDEAPPLTYMLSYYCLQKLSGGAWECCCEEIDK